VLLIWWRQECEDRLIPAALMKYYEGDPDEGSVTPTACYSKAIRFKVLVGESRKQRSKEAKK
jgi:hypothetical protein